MEVPHDHTDMVLSSTAFRYAKISDSAPSEDVLRIVRNYFKVGRGFFARIRVVNQ